MRISESHLRRSLELLRASESEPGLDQIQATIELGHILGHLNREAEAEPLLRLALDQSRRRLGPIHETSVLAARYLGSIYQQRGRLEDAESLFRRTLQECRDGGRAQSAAALNIMNGLASLLNHSEDGIAEGQRLLRECIALRLTILGPRHPDTLTSQHNLASALKRLGRLDEAETICRQTLAVRREVMGPQHLYTLRNIKLLAEILAAKGRFNEAQESLRTTLEIQRRQLGAEHPDTLETATMLTQVQKELEQAGTSQ
jgi:tetratricopeptide (TPR) repeat protein